MEQQALDVLVDQLRRSRTLASTYEALASQTDTLAITSTACKALLETLDVDHASVHRIDEDDHIETIDTWERDFNGIAASTLSMPSVAELACEKAREHFVPEGNCFAAGAVFHARSDAEDETDQGIHQACALPAEGAHGARIIVVIASRNSTSLGCESNEHLLRSLLSQLATTLDRQLLYDKLVHQALHDQLTGLPNRHFFESELDSRISTLSDNELTEGVHVLFVDVDGFKHVNDTRGHTTGDQLLALFAHRLETSLGMDAFIARIGGDEFAILADQTFSAESLATRLIDVLEKPLVLDDHALQLCVSIGASRWPEDGETADDLLRHADYAMYESKRSSGSAFHAFVPAYATRRQERTRLESDLHRAIEQGEFKLVYQPQFRLDDDVPVGVEALIRWIHPERGIVSPLEFIPAAEDLGLINTIGMSVLEMAIAQLAAWKGSKLEGLRMSVNVAATQLQDSNFVAHIIDTLKQHDVAPEQLELEMTESIVMRDVECAAERLAVLRDIGVSIAVDDFGTGYSSLSYLQDLPLDVLKIDRSFVSRLSATTADNCLVRTILTLARALELETVAEGVETREQRDVIHRMGCLKVQGYLYSPPVDAETLENALDELYAEARASRPHPRAA